MFRNEPRRVDDGRLPKKSSTRLSISRRTPSKRRRAGGEADVISVFTGILFVVSVMTARSMIMQLAPPPSRSIYIDVESRYPLAKCGEVSSVGPEAELAAKFPFSSPPTSAKSVPFPFIKRRCLDGQKIKASGVDGGRCAHVESRRQKEDTSIEYCPILKTNRGSYSPKGVQPWGVPRFSRLNAGPIRSTWARPRRSAGLFFSSAAKFFLFGPSPQASRTRSPRHRENAALGGPGWAESNRASRPGAEHHGQPSA